MPRKPCCDASRFTGTNRRPTTPFLCRLHASPAVPRRATVHGRKTPPCNAVLAQIRYSAKLTATHVGPRTQIAALRHRSRADYTLRLPRCAPVHGHKSRPDNAVSRRLHAAPAVLQRAPVHWCKLLPDNAFLHRLGSAQAVPRRTSDSRAQIAARQLRSYAD